MPCGHSSLATDAINCTRVDKDIPGVVNSFESCIIKASKKSKHGLPEDIHINRFVEAFNDLIPILRLLGTAFYFVEKDIIEKLTAIKNNQASQAGTDHDRTILDFVHWEKETKGAAMLKDKTTTARHTLRLMRALHFISVRHKIEFSSTPVPH